jgi:hypothetical protein
MNSISLSPRVPTLQLRSAAALLSIALSAAWLPEGFAQTPKSESPKAAPQTNAPAQPKNAKARPRSGYDDSILQEMDHGPFYSGVFNGRDISLKGIAIKVGPGGQAGVVFDTLTLRYADAWTGGFISIGGERTLGCNSTPIGEIAFSTSVGPGWAKSGTFDAPRPRYTSRPGVDRRRNLPQHQGIADGPLPRDWAHYQGLYRNGEQVILAYTVGQVNVLDMPGLENRNGLSVFTRTLNIGASGETLTALICDNATATGTVEDGVAWLASGDTVVAVGLLGAPSGASLAIADRGRVLLTVPKLSKAANFQVVIAKFPINETSKFKIGLKGPNFILDLPPLCQGGSPNRMPLWKETLMLKGKVGSGQDAYVVDTIPIPDRTNPWKSWIRCSGFDFFSDGRAAVCSLSGDVWIVSGLDAQLEKVTWKRFASGLYQPLGLKIVKDTVYILGRDQITRLHDLNKDSEADYYENFNNDIAITENYHEFALNLETDSKGNFYFTKGGNLGNWTHLHHGSLIKVSPDGSKLEPVATGLRAPNGLSVGPNDEITNADNEGNWVPTSRVNLINPGGFYGHVFTAHRTPDPTDYDKPIFWLPYNMDNSSGGQVWVTSAQWGPFQGDMLHQSYGKGTLFKTWTQTVDGQIQGGFVRFPLSFDSGIMRGRFSRFDGQLYTLGLRVWQSSGAKDGAFHRVRYTGGKVAMPTQLNVKKNGIEITFTEALDPVTAQDPGSYSVDQWNYKWAKEYGSKLYSVKDPAKAIEKSLQSSSGDPVQIKSVQLSNGNKTVFLELEEVQPVMQQHVRFSLSDASGKPLKVTELYHTINKVPVQ